VTHQLGKFQDQLLGALFAAGYFLAFLSFAVRWLFRQVREIIRLRKEKKTAELLHLKSQVNPHFFFNMLNNLYGLVAQDGERAQQLILKLSELMRYGIYEGQKELVPLTGEIEYLKNYVVLHRMRYHKTIAIDFSVELADRDWRVMPLLFIILLENAFKHGVENLRQGAYVKITLTTTEKDIYFRVENNFDPEESGDPPGIGLANLERRLQLAYPDQYRYHTNRTADTYVAELTLYPA
ncbi:MAG: histidine kinase, partial [Bacteroidota bacterium]